MILDHSNVIYLVLSMSTLPDITGILLIEKKNISLNWFIYLFSGNCWSFESSLLVLSMSTLPAQSSKLHI